MKIDLNLSIQIASDCDKDRIMKAIMAVLTTALERRFESWMHYYAIDADGDICGFDHQPYIPEPHEYWESTGAPYQQIGQVKACGAWRETLTRIKPEAS